MTTQPLPARPNLAQLKKQAKDLLQAATANEPGARARFRALPSLAQASDDELAGLNFALHDAQSAIAREYGFVSWTALRERVEELVLKYDEAVAQFSRGSVEQRLGRAERMLALYPKLIAEDFHAALAYGDAAAVQRHLAANPALATRRGGPLDWEPILYVAHSHWCTKNSAGLVEVARLLLARGADANTSYPWHGDPKQKLPVLWAAACHTRHFALAQLLLESGAKPDDGESMYHAAEQGNVPMLDLLAAHGAQADGGVGAEPWGNTPLYFILGHYAGLAHDAEVRRGAAWLLEHGANPNRVCYPKKSAETPLHAAALHWDGPMIELLLRHGADPTARRADGSTALTLALTNGRESAAAALRAAGVVENLSPAERFIAACFRGDRAEALRLRDPAFVTAHASVLAEATGHGRSAALETMIACGFDVTQTDQMGATPLHWSAFIGNVEAVRLLLAHGAPVAQRDTMYHANALGWCNYAAVNQPNPKADFRAVARELLAAGVPPPTAEELLDWGDTEITEIIAQFQREKK